MEPIVIMPDSAIVYLYIEGIWYCYDSSKPPLGEGSIGIVYLGFRCDNQDRVAIKRINSKFVNNPIIRGFVRYEASLRFTHPNIIKMIGLCEYTNGIGDMYLICEYIPGVTFKDRAIQLSVVSQVNATRQVLEDIKALLPGLEYLHSRGFVHRDLKPSNIMIDNSSKVKIMDLGTVILSDQMRRNTQLDFVGTPNYASPEQVQCMPCDARSDIYSIGVVMYELLTGENPFNGSSREEIFNKHLYMPLPPCNKLSPKLYSIIEKATRKNAEDRFSSVWELDVALTEYLAHAGAKSSLSRVILSSIVIIIGVLLWVFVLQAIMA